MQLVLSEAGIAGFRQNGVQPLVVRLHVQRLDLLAGIGQAQDEHLPLGRLTALGLQHVLVMYAGAVAVPLIVIVSLIVLKYLPATAGLPLARAAGVVAFGYAAFLATTLGADDVLGEATTAWLARCTARDGFRRARERQKG